MKATFMPVPAQDMPASRSIATQEEASCKHGVFKAHRLLYFRTQEEACCKHGVSTRLSAILAIAETHDPSERVLD